MATRGRKPKPTAMKELEGNPGKHPLNTSEPKPNKKAPACPKWLEPEAKKEWRRLAKQMEAIGILTEVDMAAFAGYCQAYARWKEAEEFITQHAYQEALDNPAEENVFKQLRLNMWVSSLTRFIPEHIYNLGSQPIDMEALKGRDCYGGLDLSSTGDITAFVLMFPPRVPEEKYIMLPFFWIPEDTIPQRVRRASVPYDVWYQQGYLMATEGNVIHYGFIEKVIEELGKTYHILEIAFDRWGAVQMTQNLEGMGFTVVPFGQGCL